MGLPVVQWCEHPGPVGKLGGTGPTGQDLVQPEEGDNVCRRYRQQVEGITIFLPTTVCGVNTRFVVDTGANITLLSRRIYEQIPVSQRPVLQHATKFSKVETSNDSLLDVDGVASLNFRAGGQNFERSVYVAATKEDGVLGLDFLTEQDYKLPASQGLFLNGTKVHVDVNDLLPSVSRVTVKEDTVIPAECEFISL